MRPGVIVRDAERVTPASAPTDIGRWFTAGISTRGPVGAPTRVASLSQFTAVFGARDTGSPLYDALETFFREGGGSAYVSRVVGPGAAASSVSLDDSGSAAAVTVTAVNPGVWGDGLRVAVIAGTGGGTFVLVITDTTGAELERSPDCTTVADIVAWPAKHVVVAAVGSNPPATVAATALTGGTDDRGSITDTQWAAALDAFTRDLGPGQVSAPGRTTQTGHEQLLAHAAERNRIALLDSVDTGVVGTLTSAATTLSARDDARFGAMLAPWIQVPGIVTGTTRTVPPSALAAGLIARQDAAGITPAEPAAGERGIARWALGPAQAWTDSEHETLNSAAVDAFRDIYGDLRLYGYRTLEPHEDLRWWQLSTMRLRMLIDAQMRQIGERYVFGMVDGKGQTLSRLAGEITGMLLAHHTAGALYGDTPEEAFRVDVGPAVNPPEQLAEGVINAVVVIRPAPFGEQVVIELVRVGITEPV